MTRKQEKAKFRKTKAWNNFRKKMFELSGGIDAITGKPLRPGWQLHHMDMDPEHYTHLDPDKFVCLNKKTHDVVHFLFRYDIMKVIKGLTQVLIKMHKINKR